jgi:hypothetical protein
VIGRRGVEIPSLAGCGAHERSRREGESACGFVRLILCGRPRGLPSATTKMAQD